MTDIVERLRRKVFHGPTMEAAHTRTVEWQAADEIERLTAENEKLRAALRDIEGMIPHATPDYSHRVWTIARAALEVK